MPLRLKRFYENAGLHFVTFSCYHREPNLQSSIRKDLLLSLLERVRQQYHFAIIGCVVMPEHVHLLLSKPERANLSILVQVLKQIKADRFTKGVGQRAKCARGEFLAAPVL